MLTKQWQDSSHVIYVVIQKFSSIFHNVMTTKTKVAFSSFWAGIEGLGIHWFLVETCGEIHKRYIIIGWWNALIWKGKFSSVKLYVFISGYERSGDFSWEIKSHLLNGFERGKAWSSYYYNFNGRLWPDSGLPNLDFHVEVQLLHTPMFFRKEYRIFWICADIHTVTNINSKLMVITIK